LSGKMAFKLGLMHLVQPTSVMSDASSVFNESFGFLPTEVTQGKAD
jgi:hypothetical protein